MVLKCDGLFWAYIITFFFRVFCSSFFNSSDLHIPYRVSVNSVSFPNIVIVTDLMS